MGTFEHVKGGWKSLKGYWCKNIVIGLFYQVLFIINYILILSFIQIGLLGLLAPLVFGLILQGIQQYGRMNSSFIMYKKQQLLFRDYFYFLKSIQKCRKSLLKWMLKKFLIFLWSLLLVMGVIKSLAYKMSNYIALEKENLGIYEPLRRSEEIMEGNKCKLFKMSILFSLFDILYYIFLVVTLIELNQDNSNNTAILILSLIIFLIVLFQKLFLKPLYYSSIACFYFSIKGEEEVIIQVNNETVGKQLQQKGQVEVK